MTIIKPQSNETLYSNTVIGTLAVEGCGVNIWYSEEGPGWTEAPPSPLLPSRKILTFPDKFAAKKLNKCTKFVDTDSNLIFFSINCILSHSGGGLKPAAY